MRHMSHKPNISDLRHRKAGATACHLMWETRLGKEMGPSINSPCLHCGGERGEGTTARHRVGASCAVLDISWTQLPRSTERCLVLEAAVSSGQRGKWL